MTIARRWGVWLSHDWRPWTILAYAALAVVLVISQKGDKDALRRNCETNVRLAETQVRLATASLFNRRLLARYLYDPAARAAYQATLGPARDRLKQALSDLRTIDC